MFDTAPYLKPVPFRERVLSLLEDFEELDSQNDKLKAALREDCRNEKVFKFDFKEVEALNKLDAGGLACCDKSLAPKVGTERLAMLSSEDIYVPSERLPIDTCTSNGRITFEGSSLALLEIASSSMDLGSPTSVNHGGSDVSLPPTPLTPSCVPSPFKDQTSTLCAVGSRRNTTPAHLQQRKSRSVRRTTRTGVRAKIRLQAMPSFASMEDTRIVRIRRAIAYVVVTHAFESFIGFIIIANVIFMGWASNFMAANPHTPETLTMGCVNLSFCMLYFIELMLRCIVYGPRSFWFSQQDRLWNAFDTVLVIQGIVEQFIFWLDLDSSRTGQAAYLRAVRLAKLLKTLRVIRLVRIMRELRVILFSIMGSMSGLLWSVVLIVATLFMFSMVFVQACAEFQRNEGDRISSKLRQEIESYWSSVEAGMLTLFVSSTGGDDWVRRVDVLAHVGYPYYGFFCLYISFFLCVLMNTITALFVETTFSTASKDLQFTIQSVLENKADYVNALKMLFHEMDTDGSGCVTEEEFVQKLDDPQLHAFVESLDIEVSDAEHFFHLLSDEGRTKVDLEAFVLGCTRLKGQALSIDVQDLLIRQSYAMRVIESIEEQVSRIALMLQEVKP